jgi:hypothetical protein
MELLVIVAIKLAKNLHNVGVGVGATEGISSAIETKDKLGEFARDDGLLNVGATSFDS